MGTLIADIISIILDTIDMDSLRISKIVKGSRFTGTLLENGSCGLCFSISTEGSLNSCEYIKDTKEFQELDISKVLNLAQKTDKKLERIIGISLLNAISQYIIANKKENYQILFNKDPIHHIPFDKSDQIAMVGYIGPILQKLQSITKNIIVFDERLNDSHLDFVEDLKSTQEYLQAADIVLITGSALENGTLDLLLQWSENARELIVVGPTAGFLPEPLFDRGGTILSGMQVVEPNNVLNILAEGGGTPHFKKFCKKYNIIRRRNMHNGN